MSGKSMRRTIVSLFFLSALALFSITRADAQCTGAGGIPFNCQAGATPQTGDYILGGATSGTFANDTVRWTWSQPFSTFLASPYPIGSVTPNTGAFTTFSAGSGSLTIDGSGNVTTSGTVHANNSSGAVVQGTTTSGTGVTGSASSGTGGHFSSISGSALTTGTGNVGVGTTSPSALFSVGSGSAFTVNNSGNVAASGTVTLSGLPTTCSGKPTNSVAAVAGVLTLCP